MARYLKLDKSLYGVDGMVELVRGDDWALPAKVVDLVQGVEFDVDLTTAAASAFFPAASGGFIEGSISISDADCGKVVLSLGQADTPSVMLSDAGTAPYVTIEDAGSLHTLNPEDAPLKIIDRGTV